MATMLSSQIFVPPFNDDEASNLLSDVALVRALVQVEVALARAEARVGVISASGPRRHASPVRNPAPIVPRASYRAC